MVNKSILLFILAVFLTLMLTILQLSTLIPMAAQAQTSSGPYPGKTQYPWPQNKHDPSCTAFTESTGPKTNHLLWTNTIGRWGDYQLRCPVVSDGMVFIGSFSNSYMRALDAETGELIWQYKAEGKTNSAAVFYGRVYFGSNPDYIYCLDEFSGDLIWKYKTGTGFAPGTMGFSCVPGKIVIGSYDDNVYCLQPETGQLLWNFTAPELTHGVYGFLHGTPGIADGKVYIGQTIVGAIYCLDLETGNLLWSRKPSNTIPTTSVVDGIVYAGMGEMTPPFGIQALNATTGDVIWTFETGAPTTHGPAVAYGNVYIGAHDFNLYCLTADTGELVWKWLCEAGSVYPSPVVADGVVYVGAHDYAVHAFDAETGAQIWNYSTHNEMWGNPSIADGRLYTVSNDGILYAFGKGPTDMSLSVTSSSAKLGDSIVVSGSVMDVSPYTLQRPDLQAPQVANVPVILSYVMDGGAWTDFATVTTASDGSYSLEWTPPDEGIYTVTARFEGDDSYEWASTETKVQVGPAPPDVPTAEEIAEEVDVPTADEVAQEVIDQLPAYSTTDILIAAVAIVTLCIVLYNLYTIRKLRK